MKPKRQDEHVKYVIDMYVISKELSVEPLKITVQAKNSCVGLDLIVLCLSNMQVNEKDDVIYYGANCRGDYTTNEKCEFNPSHYKNIRQWMEHTFPMTKDGAVKILESFDGNDYEEYIELQLSKLSQNTTELLLCVSVYDEHFSLKDVPSLNISLLKNIGGTMKSPYEKMKTENGMDSSKECKVCLDSYYINLNGTYSNAAVLGIIKRTEDQFIFEPYYKLYKNIVELANYYC